MLRSLGTGHYGNGKRRIAQAVMHRSNSVLFGRLQREGSSRASMVSALLERISSLVGEEAIEEEDIARNTVAVAYAGESVFVMFPTAIVEYRARRGPHRQLEPIR